MYDLVETYKKVSVLIWLIDGMGQHGLKISDASIITWDWVVENYNVSGFVCKHIKVDQDTIGMVQSADGKHYDAFCVCCEKTVHGTIGLRGQIVHRWK